MAPAAEASRAGPAAVPKAPKTPTYGTPLGPPIPANPALIRFKKKWRQRTLTKYGARLHADAVRRQFEDFLTFYEPSIATWALGGKSGGKRLPNTVPYPRRLNISQRRLLITFMRCLLYHGPREIGVTEIQKVKGPPLKRKFEPTERFFIFKGLDENIDVLVLRNDKKFRKRQIVSHRFSRKRPLREKPKL